jgi:hypothetical protein
MDAADDDEAAVSMKEAISGKIRGNVQARREVAYRATLNCGSVKGAARPFGYLVI